MVPESKHDVQAACRELKSLLREKILLGRGEGQPIEMPNGTPAAWVFYTWDVTLSGRGLQLAAMCLLDRLRLFRGTQLATCGFGGMSLLSACLALGAGRYTGLFVRDQRKAYGPLRRIEGPMDRKVPVIVLDDTVGSGSSMLRAIEAVEEEGLQVEGGVALVNIPGAGGIETLRASGYRVECIFDSYEDLDMPRSKLTPGYRALLPDSWAQLRVPEGLHPATAARWIAEAYLGDGKCPLPPERLDAVYDGSGGVFVSFREPESDIRINRGGFWHFDPGDADPCRDLVLATVATISDRDFPISMEMLPDLKIAVTFFGRMEKIRPAQLDFSRYGIVVCSLDGSRMGGALPNTQYFTNEIQQYHHARVVNAGLTYMEPHDLYRHTLTKYVEPGQYWLPFGSPENPSNDWTRMDQIGERLIKRVHALLENVPADTIPDSLVPAPVFGIGVTLYHRGVLGCGVSWGASLDECLCRAADMALHDERFLDCQRPVSTGDLAFSVSVLHDRQWIGEVKAEEAAEKMRLGLDSISVAQGEREAIFLPSAVVYFNWTKEETARELLFKAGISHPPCNWAIFPTETWLAKGDHRWKLKFAFPDRSDEPHDSTRWEEDITLLGSYIFRHLGQDGLPDYEYFPTEGRLVHEGDLARVIYGLGALRAAARLLGNSGWEEASLRGLSMAYHAMTDVDMPSRARGNSATGVRDSMADCLLVAALASSKKNSSGGGDESAIDLIHGLFCEDGRITDMPFARGLQADHDHLPGAALLALVSVMNPSDIDAWSGRLDACLEWYRRRFRLVHPWGMVGWQTRGWAAIHSRIPKPEYADFVFEMADWALDWQHEKSGAFLADVGDGGISFLTAFFAEGIAAAWSLAELTGDENRSARYSHSCCEALRFMNRLVIRPDDTFCMVEPELAIGGIRGSLAQTSVRIDYVAHTLTALIQSYLASRVNQIGSA